MGAVVKKELVERNGTVRTVSETVIALEESEGLGKNGDGGVSRRALKKRRLEEMGVIIPVMDLQPLPLEELPLLTGPEQAAGRYTIKDCRQFWKAGEYEGVPSSNCDHTAGGIDHVRIHPKFLHTNATSHKWVLGAFAELLDNALDEVCFGATYVNVDMLANKKHQSKMLLIEDNGGGMNPERIRDCMSLGFSKKNHIADTIGQYGNGFKTSTMRLGADVIVFSRCCGIDGQSATQSIGLLSYTFLRSTGKEDTIVPILDYEGRQGKWNKMIRSSLSDWNKNVETILQWSPFSTEKDLEHQFYMIRENGTRIIIYNLWEDDEGQLELDFDSDPHDIQIRGVNRDEKNIQMAKQFPNSRHFLTYRHSLRSYAAILYLRLPSGFRIILRGKDVDHHNIANDMMMSQKITYRPKDGIPKDSNMIVNVIIGFVKDAKHHIDVQGFNVYHKNRLIKPFWRLWNAAGSDGRGVIGILEANFIEPAHDKQGFERTTILSRLEAKLVQMQKTYWSTNCHKIGYAARRNKKGIDTKDKNISQDFIMEREDNTPSSKRPRSALDKLHSRAEDNGYEDIRVSGKGEKSVQTHKKSTPSKYGAELSSSEASLPSPANVWDANMHKKVNGIGESGDNYMYVSKKVNGTNHKVSTAKHYSDNEDTQFRQVCTPCRGANLSRSKSNENDYDGEYSPMVGDSSIVEQLKKENYELKEKLKKYDGDAVAALLKDLQSEKDRSKKLETQFKEAEEKIELLNKEQDNLIEIFLDERNRRDNEDVNLRKKLQEASNTIQDLVEKIRRLEGRN